MLFNSPVPQLSPIHIYQYVRKTCLPARLSTWRQDNLRKRLYIMAGALGKRIDTSFEDHRSRCALWEESTFCVVDWRITSYLLREAWACCPYVGERKREPGIWHFTGSRATNGFRRCVAGGPLGAWKRLAPHLMVVVRKDSSSSRSCFGVCPRPASMYSRILRQCNESGVFSTKLPKLWRQVESRRD